tara:strand:- start:2915 stop:3250 length:336 start_codon:yes stop_codon:yes gene_type:complete
MPAHATTVALRDEVATPSVVNLRSVRRGLGGARKGFNQVSEQASKIQQLLADAEANEDLPHYAQKLESLRQTCTALQREHDKLEERAAVFARVLSGAEQEFEDFVAFMDAD